MTKPTDWASKFTRPDTAPAVAEEAAAPVAAPAAPKAPKSRAKAPRTAPPAKPDVEPPRRLGRPPKAKLTPVIGVNFRLEEEVVRLIDLAVEDAYSRGVRLSKQEAVAAAIRSKYGRLAK